MTLSKLSDLTNCPRCDGPLKSSQTVKGMRRSCAAQCGRWHLRKSDDEIRSIVEEVRAGATWHATMIRHKVDRKTVVDRGALLGLELPKGCRKTVRPMRLNLPAEPSRLGYLAGIIDGEGSICIRLLATPRAYVWVMVTNTDELLMEWLASIGGSVTKKSSTTESLGRKQCFNWMVQARLDCLALLRAIEPSLLVKREKAQAAITILEEWTK